MEFLWPGLLVLLGLLPLLVLLYVLGQRRRRPSGVRYSSLVLIREALPRSSFVRRHLPFALFALALAGLAVALARPVVIASVPTNQTTIVLAIDVSGSMCSTDIPPSRLQAAEDAAIAFIESQGTSTQIGIVAFAGFAEIVQAPTTDRQVLLDAVRSLATGRRTAVGSGILDAIDAISEIDPAVAKSRTDASPGLPPAPVPKGAYVPEIIVLLTDGASNAGPLPLDAAQQAADRGVRVYTIGFGTANPGSHGSNLRAEPGWSRAGRWRRVRRVRWRRRVGRRVPAGDRRRHAQAGRRAHRRGVLPGRERRAAPGRVPGPADEPHHEARGPRDRRRLRRRSAPSPRDSRFCSEGRGARCPDAGAPMGRSSVLSTARTRKEPTMIVRRFKGRAGAAMVAAILGALVASFAFAGVASASSPPSCTASQLSARIVDWQGAAGSRIADIELVNTSFSACTIRNNPRVRLVSAHGATLINGPAASTTGATHVLAGLGFLKAEAKASNYCGHAYAKPGDAPVRPARHAGAPSWRSRSPRPIPPASRRATARPDQPAPSRCTPGTPDEALAEEIGPDAHTPSSPTSPTRSRRIACGRTRSRSTAGSTSWSTTPGSRRAPTSTARSTSGSRSGTCRSA